MRPHADQPEVAGHAQHKEGDSEDRADDEARPLLADLRLPRRTLGVLRLLTLINLDNAVADQLDAVDEVAAGERAGHVADPRLLRGQVDGHVQHAVELAEALLDRRNTVGARHAGDGQFRLGDGHVIARQPDSLDKVLLVQQFRVELDRGALRCQVDLHIFDAFQLA